MRVVAFSLIAGLLCPALARAQTCVESAITCNGRWVEIPCGATDAEIVAACGGGSSGLRSGGGESALVLVQLVGGTVDLFKSVNKEQIDAFLLREQSDRAAEVSSKYSPVTCVLLLDDIAESTEAFAKEGEEFATSFAKSEFDDVIDKLQDQHKTKSKHRKAYEAVTKWRASVEAWSKDLREWETCLRTPGCRVLDLVKKDNATLAKWLKKMDWTGQDAAERVDRTASFLESYGKRIAESNLAYAQKAAECSVK